MEKRDRGARGLAILSGARSSFLDHLAPWAELLNLKLLIQDSWTQHLAEIYYPSLTVVEEREEELQEADYFFYPEPSKLYPFGFQFGNLYYPEAKRSFVCLHGNSDKYRHTFWAERFCDEEHVLLYGQHMVDFMKSRGVSLNRVIRTGNVRYHYYKKYQSFFDRFSPLYDRKKRVIFYAPTWSHPSEKEESSPFFNVIEELLKPPEEFFLIIKPHPFYFRLFPNEMASLIERRRENVHFVLEEPLIYPYLSLADIYLGDFSSIGYDFLVFNKPLFFLTHQNRRKGQDLLFQCGEVIEEKFYKNIYARFSRTQEHLSQQREALYHYAFDEREEGLKEEIEKCLG